MITVLIAAVPATATLLRPHPHVLMTRMTTRSTIDPTITITRTTDITTTDPEAHHTIMWIETLCSQAPLDTD
jgi:hypothetical protein